MTGATAASPANISTGQTLSPAYVNAYRISAVTLRLLAHVRGEVRSDSGEFCNLCLSLARGIDYAVSNNEIPDRAPDLPYLLKQVCQRKNDLTSQAAVMVLMISVKSACSNGWFGEKEKEELCVLSKEGSFSSVGFNDLSSNVKNTESNSHPAISTIMSRFYPGMKMGEIFSLIETAVGYDSYVTDLYISKSSKISPGDKLYLFVAQTDNVETSSCLINPPQVNILLNGEGVDRRTCLYKDPGPQMPTPVTHMLKYGSNLLQAVGQFNGKYIIVIGFMTMVSNPSFPIIPDYVPLDAAQSDSDNEIIEGPSRISLKCPISFSRIKIPVKGHTCKHLQCFDFNNYVEINSRRPLWRCPHCSQSVCFSDIRIDQSMVKVLKEVGEDVSYVKISGDGSWESVTENISNEHTEKPNDAPPSNQGTSAQNVDDDIMDLTENDNEMDKNDKDDNKKPSPAGESGVINKTIAPHMEDGYWNDFYSSPLRSTSSTDSRSDRDVVQRNHPVLNPFGQSQMPNNGNGHARYPMSHTWVTRSQNAIQALPAQSQSQTSPQVGAHSASPQQINGVRHPSPLSTDRFNSNQRIPHPVRPSGQPSPHVRVAGAHGGLASSPSPRFSPTAIERALSKITSQSPSPPPPVQTSGASPGPVAPTTDQRGSSEEASTEENWRPAGRMRGSLSGWQYTEALKNQFIIEPSQPVQAARPPPVMNTPRPFIPPHLQALMANSPRPQAGGSSPGSSPGSDSNTADK